MSDWLHQTRPNRRSVVKPNTIRFRDLNCDYLMFANQSQLIVDNHLAIRTQLKNLFSTPTGTEDFEPNFGSNLPYRIMEPISPLMGYLIETDTILAIGDWLSDRMRLVLPGASVTPLVDEEGYNVTIPYISVLDNTFSVFSTDILR